MQPVVSHPEDGKCVPTTFWAQDLVGHKGQSPGLMEFPLNGGKWTKAAKHQLFLSDNKCL